jgi:hypothetical protein
MKMAPKIYSYSEVRTCDFLRVGWELGIDGRDDRVLVMFTTTEAGLITVITENNLVYSFVNKSLYLPTEDLKYIELKAECTVGKGSECKALSLVEAAESGKPIDELTFYSSGRHVAVNVGESVQDAYLRHVHSCIPELDEDSTNKLHALATKHLEKDTDFVTLGTDYYSSWRKSGV